MPNARLPDVSLHYQIDGDAAAPPLLLSNSLGTSLEMWEPQMAALAGRFRVIRYDSRGHGQSTVTPGPYTIEQVASDALGLLDALKVPRAHFCGLSMGGMVGMWLGAKAPQRVNRLILSNTSAWFADKEIWNGRIKTVREKGLASIVGGTMERWFTAGFREREPKKIEWLSEMFLRTDPEGYIACGEAVRDMDHREIIKSITAPTLVIAGRHDPATTVEHGEFIRSRIPGASMTVLDAAHIANVEQPHDYTDAVLGFLQQK